MSTLHMCAEMMIIHYHFTSPLDCLSFAIQKVQFCDAIACTTLSQLTGIQYSAILPVYGAHE